MTTPISFRVTTSDGKHHDFRSDSKDLNIQNIYRLLQHLKIHGNATQKKLLRDNEITSLAELQEIIDLDAWAYSYPRDESTGGKYHFPESLGGTSNYSDLRPLSTALGEEPLRTVPGPKASVAINTLLLLFPEVRDFRAGQNNRSLDFATSLRFAELKKLATRWCGVGYPLQHEVLAMRTLDNLLQSTGDDFSGTSLQHNYDTVLKRLGAHEAMHFLLTLLQLQSYCAPNHSSLQQRLYSFVENAVAQMAEATAARPMDLRRIYRLVAMAEAVEISAQHRPDRLQFIPEQGERAHAQTAQQIAAIFSQLSQEYPTLSLVRRYIAEHRKPSDYSIEQNPSETYPSILGELDESSDTLVALFKAFRAADVITRKPGDIIAEYRLLTGYSDHKKSPLEDYAKIHRAEMLKANPAGKNEIPSFVVPMKAALTGAKKMYKDDIRKGAGYDSSAKVPSDVLAKQVQAGAFFQHVYDHPKFKAFWSWFEQLEGDIMPPFHIVVAREFTIDGIVRFGGAHQRYSALVMNPTIKGGVGIPGHRNNPGEFANTFIHELFHIYFPVLIVAKKLGFDVKDIFEEPFHGKRLTDAYNGENVLPRKLSFKVDSNQNGRIDDADETVTITNASERRQKANLEAASATDENAAYILGNFGTSASAEGAVSDLSLAAEWWLREIIIEAYYATVSELKELGRIEDGDEERLYFSIHHFAFTFQEWMHIRDKEVNEETIAEWAQDLAGDDDTKAKWLLTWMRKSLEQLDEEGADADHRH